MKNLEQKNEKSNFRNGFYLELLAIGVGRHFAISTFFIIHLSKPNGSLTPWPHRQIARLLVYIPHDYQFIIFVQLGIVDILHLRRRPQILTMKLSSILSFLYITFLRNRAILASICDSVCSARNTHKTSSVYEAWCGGCCCCCNDHQFQLAC